MISIRTVPRAPPEFFAVVDGWKIQRPVACQGQSAANIIRFIRNSLVPRASTRHRRRSADRSERSRLRDGSHAAQTRQGLRSMRPLELPGHLRATCQVPLTSRARWCLLAEELNPNFCTDSVRSLEEERLRPIGSAKFRRGQRRNADVYAGTAQYCRSRTGERIPTPGLPRKRLARLNRPFFRRHDEAVIGNGEADRRREEVLYARVLAAGALCHAAAQSVTFSRDCRTRGVGDVFLRRHATSRNKQCNSNS